MSDGANTAEALKETEELEKIETVGKELDEIADIDIDQVDLGLPKEYEDWLMARHRLNAAREALVAKRMAAANKAVNDTESQRYHKVYAAHATFVALVDRYHPNAKKLSAEVAREVLKEEERQREARKKAEAEALAS